MKCELISTSFQNILVRPRICRESALVVHITCVRNITNSVFAVLNTQAELISTKVTLNIALHAQLKCIFYLFVRLPYPIFVGINI